MRLVRALRFIAMLLIFVFTSNLSVSVAAPKDSQGLSWNKSDQRNAAAHGHFKEDKVIRQLVKDFSKQGYNIDTENPVFMNYSSAADGDWLAVAVTAKLEDRQVLITGFVNERNGKVEHVTSTEYVVLDQAKKLVQINGSRFDHGNLKRQASVVWDAVKNRAVTDSGDLLALGGQTIGTVTFGATADAAWCTENFICSMIYAVISTLICYLLAITVIGGLICGLVLTVTSYLYCYVDYNCD